MKRHLSIGGMLCEPLCRKHEAFDFEITAMACVTKRTCLAQQMSDVVSECYVTC
jgi:hypothetical protein